MAHLAHPLYSKLEYDLCIHQRSSSQCFQGRGAQQRVSHEDKKKKKNPYGRNLKKKGALETKESFTSHHEDKFERISVVEREREEERGHLAVSQNNLCKARRIK